MEYNKDFVITCKKCGSTNCTISIVTEYEEGYECNPPVACEYIVIICSDCHNEHNEMC